MVASKTSKLLIQTDDPEPHNVTLLGCDLADQKTSAW